MVSLTNNTGIHGCWRIKSRWLYRCTAPGQSPPPPCCRLRHNTITTDRPRTQARRRKAPSSCSCASLHTCRLTWAGVPRVESAAKSTSHSLAPGHRRRSSNLEPSPLAIAGFAAVGSLRWHAPVRECTPLTRGCATLARGTCEPSGFRPGPRTAAKRTSVHGFANKQATRFSLSGLQSWDRLRNRYCEIGMDVANGSTGASRGRESTRGFLAPARRETQMRWKGQQPSADHTWVYCDIHSFCLSARQLPASRKPGSTPVSGGFAAGLSVGGCVKGAIASGVLIANPATPAIRIWHRCCFVSRRPSLRLSPEACLFRLSLYACLHYRLSLCGRARHVTSPPLPSQPLSVNVKTVFSHISFIFALPQV